MINFKHLNWTPPEIPEFDLRDPDEVTSKILVFLTQQSNNAKKQFIVSRNLIIATIVIMILQIVYGVWTNYESNSKQNSLIQIIDTQSQQSEVISRMSLNLLDLQNQVRILEEENAKLNQNLTN